MRRVDILLLILLTSSAPRAAPRLKDAKIEDQSVYASLYTELILNIRKLFHQCKLVHADLSEYNILYHNGHLYIIDVSQSVEHDHPSAFDFLRNDIKNVDDFFSKMGVRCLGLRRSFEFIVKENLDSTANETNEEDVLKKLLDFSTPDDPSRDDSAKAAVGQAAHEDAVFEKSFIPRTLGELFDPERDIAALSLDNLEKPIYANTIELVRPTRDPAGEEMVRADVSGELQVSLSDDDSQDSKSSTDSEAGEGDSRPFEDKHPRGHRHEDRELKKVPPPFPYTRRCLIPAQERKKATKAEQREKRKSKMPKAEKKRRMKASR